LHYFGLFCPVILFVSIIFSPLVFAIDNWTVESAYKSTTEPFLCKATKKCVEEAVGFIDAL
jgi:hypothetical protein